ncbi:female sterile (1) Nasrat [Lasioglossum baleicum]|uniref:female sterile (1) Nasrat n=1 Tax=Lasioglossum baleicum TaxID=434251 RepID=UPI003FCE572B
MFSFNCSIVLLIFVSASVIKCSDLDESIKNLHQLLHTKSQRVQRDSEDDSSIWLDYEFNTGAGNREEVVVRNISVHESRKLPKNGAWRYFDANGVGFLVHSEPSTLLFYKLDPNNVLTDDPVFLNVTGEILTYKVLVSDSFHSAGTPEADVVVVLCVKSVGGILLQWHRLFDDGSFRDYFWQWEIHKRIKHIEYLQYGTRHELLLFDENETQFQIPYSPIYIYSFSIDFFTKSYHYGLRQSTLAPKVLGIQVCPIYQSIFLVLQGHNDVTLYEYRDNMLGNIFPETQTIKSLDLRNFVCFENGYLQFLALSGPEAGLYHFLEGEFQYNTESEANFITSEISWVKDIRLDTYREESLLLVQLRNSTVIALGWQGLSFKRIQLPHNILDQFDLSQATVIPKFGFVLGNKFVKLHTELKDLQHPSQYTMEKWLRLQPLLNDVLNSQESILDETEARLEKSYLKNPVVTGFWNIDVLNATNATVFDNVTFHVVSVGSTNMPKEDIAFNMTDYMEELNYLTDLEKKLEEIDSNLEQIRNLNVTTFDFDSGTEVVGDIDLNGTLNVDKLSVQFLNGIDVRNDDFSPENGGVIEETKQFSSLRADNLAIHSLNGVPVTDIRFASSIQNYSGIDFTKIDRAVVEGNLFLETVNGVNWKDSMRNVVWKNKDMHIPGDTVIEGSLSADTVELETLNGLRYPHDYVFIEGNTPAEVTGSKSFNQLRVGNLSGTKTINGIDINDFVILDKENAVEEEITFENLIVEGLLLVDGNITGPGIKETKLLNETSEIESHVIFANLTVLGNVIFDKAFYKQRPLNLDDLLLKDDEDAKITGTKTFLGNVEMKSNVTITSRSINGHSIEEFATTDTDQEFPNLRNISSLVTFGNVTDRHMESLEDLLNKTGNSSCLGKKIIAFTSPIVVDELSCDTIDKNVSYAEFLNKLNKTFGNIVFDSLSSETLIAEEIAPGAINDVDFKNFTEHLASSRNTANHSIDKLETDHVDVRFINGMSSEEINDLMDRLNSLLENITSGNSSIDSLQVTGKIDVNSINGVALKDLYKDHRNTVIFKNNVTIRNLTIQGLLNRFNFSDRVMDTVLKSDNDIKVYGHKTFNIVRCRELDAVSLNDHHLENIFDPKKDQLLMGPVIVNGTVTVREKFHATGSIGDVNFQDLMGKRKFLGNNTYEYNGNVHFPENVSIENLVVNGTTQGTDFDSFYKSIIFTTESNVSISGPKVFKNSVTFNNAFFVREKLNDIDLQNFWKNAVFVDKPFFIRSKVVFEDDVRVQAHLIVKTDFEAGSVMGVDVNELKLDVLYLNRPVYIEEAIEINKVVFQSNIEVAKFNDLDTRLLISLKSDQALPVEVFKCRNITVDNFKHLGRINDVDLTTIQETTFMTTGKQNITGHFNFTGLFQIRRNLNARHINGVDMARVVSLNRTRTLRGNFVFEEPMIMNESLRVMNGYLNDIDLAQWEARAVKTSDFLKQVVSGRWTVNGSVHFENGATGSSVLNGIRLDELADTLGKRQLEMNVLMAETNANLEDICEDLNRLKRAAEKQIYKFSMFEYLQSIDLDDRIVSLHHFELDDSDYLIISCDTCRMLTYLFARGKFELVANVTDFGVVDGWRTFNVDGTLYLLTSGTKGCGKNSENLWKFENNKFEHVGGKVNSRKVNKVLQTMINRKNEQRSSKINIEDLEEALSSLADDNGRKMVAQTDRQLFPSRNKARKRGVGKIMNTDIGRTSRRPEILNFKAGIFEKEIFLYYEEDVNDDHIFICDSHDTHTKILQTIKAHRPTSFAVLNFAGNIETLLLFVENRRTLQIYEYKGVQGFVHRDSINMNIDKLVNFKIRKHPGFARRHCLASIHENRLTIFEAQMYGEKVDMESLKCSVV